MAWILCVLGALGIAGGGAVLSVSFLQAAIGRALRESPRRLPALGQRLAGACVVALFAACSLAAVFLGNPVYGLVVLVFVPLGLPRLVRWWADRQSEALDVSAIAFFHALRGLVRAGLGLPYALFRLTEALPSPFSQALRPFLDRFESGRALEICLERFRHRRGLRLSGVCLSVLQMAYREGLPVAPFLDRMLPLLESDREGHARVASLRRSVAAQALVAFGAPWFLAAVMAGFQPETASHFWQGHALLWMAIALVMEGAGAWVLWHVSTFF